MAYYDLSLLSDDQDFLRRCAAAYATQGGSDVDAFAWAFDHRWQLAAQPGFADAYASALAGGVEFPGRDAAVITDPQILAAVQAVLAGEAA